MDFDDLEASSGEQVMAANRHFSIRLLMAIIFFIAADIAIIRAIWDTQGPQMGFALWPAFPKSRVDGQAGCHRAG